MKIYKELLQELQAEMPYKWRVQSSKYGKATCVAYIDSRDVQNRLDQVFGLDWKDEYKLIGNTLFCVISVLTPDNVWVSRTDCGTESNMEAEKGQASDAFKRAAVKFGIGRFLYDLGVVTLKTAKHTNEKEYPATDDGKILWSASDLNAYIEAKRSGNDGRPVIDNPTYKPAQQTEEEKPWLNLTTKDGEPTEYYERVKASCLSGSIDLKATYDKFKVNKKVREQIDAWIAEAKND